MENVRVGMVVQLKSGGPFMTIGEEKPRGSSNKYLCVWFNDKTYLEGFFHPEALKTVKDDGVSGFGRL